MDQNVINNKVLVAVIVGAALLTRNVFSQDDSKNELYLTNLDNRCILCLCHAATNCDVTLLCKGGYCGPYKISRVYWVDAGRPTFPEDDPERAGAYEDCALDLYCARRIVKGYMSKFAKDCNSDGVTDCTDYSMINFNGGYSCHQPLERNEAGKNWTTRFKRCLQ